MQITNKELYKTVASDTSRDVNLVKSVGNAVFYSVFVFFKNPPSIICKLKGVGYWYMRKKKLNEYISKWNSHYTSTTKAQYMDEKVLAEYNKNKAQYNILLERQAQYELFLIKKKQIREIRNKTQQIQIPKNQE